MFEPDAYTDNVMVCRIAHRATTTSSTEAQVVPSSLSRSRAGADVTTSVIRAGYGRPATGTKMERIARMLLSTVVCDRRCSGPLLPTIWVAFSSMSTRWRNASTSARSDDKSPLSADARFVSTTMRTRNATRLADDIFGMRVTQRRSMAQEQARSKLFKAFARSRMRSSKETEEHWIESGTAQC
ncbi:hypothetical protein PBRA_002221 [Plasmodiophora brassicae]|uniref:Uncharacterized protein n=1 Tax=Plasmodiophora brassicae TaxID=37360 RepID=A0A0G4J3V1_PLABS|nr:hypothetical protein PBRA_002221 [Plasmodiophora brassicae]